jgi:F-type H+-transporting ATPase subunit c
MRAGTTKSTRTEHLPFAACDLLGNPHAASPEKNPKNKHNMILAEITINANTIPAAFGCFAAAFGVAMIGAKAVESVGRNPEASGKILVQSILGMALAEAVAFYAIFLTK